MADVLKPDICVIGAGLGGLTVAAAAAGWGVPVLLIEKGLSGGASLDQSLPLQALTAAARRAAEIKEAGLFGLAAPKAKIKFPDIQRQIERTVEALAPHDAKERLAALGVRVIEGAARFEDRDTVLVEGKDIRVKARRFVIATGSSAATPAIDGLDAVPYLTAETVFGLTTVPKQLVVIGAGSTGLELAQAFRRLGSLVTVLSSEPPLLDEDPECVDVVLQQLAREEITIRAGVAIKQIKQSRAKMRVVIADTGSKETAIEASHLLIAAGRIPNVGDLGLEAAGVAHTADGIVVNRALKTTNKRIYAVGGVVGAPPLAHVTREQAELVVKNALLRVPVRFRDQAIARITYTEPQLAHVGLSEVELRKRGRTMRILRAPFQDNERAQAEHRLHGHIKVITTKAGRILGATIVGPDAGELITPWVLAVRCRLKVQALSGLVVPSASFADIGRRAAISYYGPRLTSPVLRRIIGLLRRFG
jgi:pyruvate/2-oxoglutarate dehydrogenase complex dihydrolipoamide dehydrogenase (E3) component